MKLVSQQSSFANLTHAFTITVVGQIEDLSFHHENPREKQVKVEFGGQGFLPY